jgi:uncharacterized protein YbcI
LLYMAATKVSRSALQSEIAAEMARFQRDSHGLFPERVSSIVVDDVVIVRSIGTFNRQEVELSDSTEGQKLIQSARREMQTDLRGDLHRLIERLTGERVLRSFYDVDVRNGDEARVFVLAQEPDIIAYGELP